MPRASIKSNPLSSETIDKISGLSSLPGHIPYYTKNTHPRGGGFQSTGEKRALSLTGSGRLLRLGSSNVSTTLRTLFGFSGNQPIQRILLVQKIALSGTPYLLISVAREWLSSLGRTGKIGETASTYSANSPLIVDIWLTKAEDFYSNDPSSQLNLIGSFKAGIIGTQQITPNNFETLDYRVSMHTISTGYSRILVVYDNTEKQAGTAIQVVDEELTAKVSSQLDIYRQTSSGSDFGDVVEEYGGSFEMTSNDNIPVIVATRTGIYFSESSADLFVRYATPNDNVEPLGGVFLSDTEDFTPFEPDESQLEDVDYKERIERLKNELDEFADPTHETFRRFTQLYSSAFTSIGTTSSQRNITTSNKSFLLARDEEKPTDPFLLKRLRFVFKIGANDVFSSWMPINKLNTTEPIEEEKTLDLHQAVETYSIGEEEMFATFDLTAGGGSGGVSPLMAVSDTLNELYLNEVGKGSRDIHVIALDTGGEKTGEKVTLSGVSNLRALYHRNGINYILTRSQGATRTYTIYSYDATQTGTVSPTAVRTIAFAPADDPNYRDFAYDGSEFYLLAEENNRQGGKVDVYGSSGALRRSFDARGEGRRTEWSIVIVPGDQNELIGILSYDDENAANGVLDLYTKTGKFSQTANNFIPRGSDTTRGVTTPNALTRIAVAGNTLYGSKGIAFDGQITDLSIYYRYTITTEKGADTFQIDENLPVKIRYNQNSKLLEVQQIRTSATVSNLSLFSVEMLTSKDRNLFQRNTLDLEPVLFDRNLPEPPATAVLAQDVFYVEDNDLKYYSQRADETRGVDVFLAGVNLVNKDAIKTIQDGIVMVRDSGDEGVIMSRIHRSQFGAGYQVNQLARFADFDKYDYSKVKIHQSAYGAVVICKRKKDNANVALIVDTRLNSQNQYNDGYSVVTLAAEPEVSWEDEGKIYYINGQNLYQLFDNSDPSIETEWYGYFDALGTMSNTKDMLAFVLYGELAEGASITASLSLDRKSYFPIGTAIYADAHPDPTELAGTSPVGSEVGGDDVGGDPAAAGRRKFEKVFQIPEGLSSEFLHCSVKLEGRGGYHAVTDFEFVDVSLHDRGRQY